jgi:hypothetical protein
MMSPSTQPLQFECEVFYSFKIFYMVHSVEVLSQDPHQNKNFISLVITNMESKFEQCVFHLI